MPEQINIPNDIYQKDVASIGVSCFLKLKISYFLLLWKYIQFNWNFKIFSYLINKKSPTTYPIKQHIFF